jgi:hypothetical protein
VNSLQGHNMRVFYNKLFENNIMVCPGTVIMKTELMMILRR